MKKSLIAFVFVNLTFTSFAQNFVNVSENDPAATEILQKINLQYNSYKTLEADFSLIIEFPELEAETQKGKLLQEGEKYKAKLVGQTLVSNGETIWAYLPKSNEVQISCVDDFEGISPKDLLRIYEQEDYIYYLANEFKENGKIIQQIEFKPVNRDSEYSKLRLTVEKSTLDVVRIKAFAKDGSRFTLKMNSLVVNKIISSDQFIWKDSDCDDCYIEDLRIDCE